MKRKLLILSGALLAGCMASNALQYGSIAETNQYHIAKIRKGMSEKEVLHIMHKPYSYESFQVEEDIYDVWFYVTRPTGLDQTRMVPQNLTPITFKNGVLVGTGYYWYYYAMKEEAQGVAAQHPIEKKKTQEEEDVEFENALRTFKPQSPSQPKPPTPKSPAETTMAPPVADLTEPVSIEVPLGKPIPKPPLCQERDLSSISTGMTETQVFSVMGEPLKYTILTMGNDVFDVWFYETVPSKMKVSEPTVPQNLTILTFKNAMLVSMSDDYFYELKERVEQTNELLEALPPQPPISEEANETEPVAHIEDVEVVTNKKSPSWSWKSLKRPWRSLLGSNKVPLSSIHKGMTRDQVENALGTPDRKEGYELDSDLYEVWFYKAANSKVKNLPLTFKNGVLDGMGPKYYQKVKDQGTLNQINGYDQPANRMQEEESEQNFDYW